MLAMELNTARNREAEKSDRADEAAREVISQIVDDARIEPEAFLGDAEVPEGGE